MTAPKTLADRIFDAHVVTEIAGHPAVLYVDLHLVHEVTSPQAFSELAARGMRVRRPDRTLATMDHAVPTVAGATASDAAQAQLDTLRTHCTEHGIELRPRVAERRYLKDFVRAEPAAPFTEHVCLCALPSCTKHSSFAGNRKRSTQQRISLQ